MTKTDDRPVLLTNATLADGTRKDIVLRDGRIAGFGESPTGDVTIVDLGGRLVLPAFIDAHVHLDKVLIGLPWQPHRAANSTAARIEAEKNFRRTSSPPVEACGARLLAMALAQGTTAVRSHVDIDDQTKLRNLEVLLHLRQTWSPLIDIQLVAFPQSGIVRCQGVAELLDEAIRMGCDLIGGLDPLGIDQDLDGHLDVVFDLADRHGIGVDIHLHDPGEPGILQILAIADRTRALGLHGKVTVSHAFCLGAVSADRATAVAEKLAEAGVAILTSGPGATPIPPVAILRKAGVRVLAGSDNIRDCWSPFGNASMLERCWLIAWRSGFRTDEDLAATLDLATTEAAAVLGLPHRGLEVGSHADLVVLEAAHVAQAIIERPKPSLVLRRGRVAHDPDNLTQATIARVALPDIPPVPAGGN